jgi:hypothetical protein
VGNFRDRSCPQPGLALNSDALKARPEFSGSNIGAPGAVFFLDCWPFWVLVDRGFRVRNLFAEPFADVESGIGGQLFDGVLWYLSSGLFSEGCWSNGSGRLFERDETLFRGLGFAAGNAEGRHGSGAAAVERAWNSPPKPGRGGGAEGLWPGSSCCREAAAA